MSMWLAGTFALFKIAVRSWKRVIFLCVIICLINLIIFTLIIFKIRSSNFYNISFLCMFILISSNISFYRYLCFLIFFFFLFISFRIAFNVRYYLKQDKGRKIVRFFLKISNNAPNL